MIDSVTATVHSNSHSAAQEHILWIWSWFDIHNLRLRIKQHQRPVKCYVFCLSVVLNAKSFSVEEKDIRYHFLLMLRRDC